MTWRPSMHRLRQAGALLSMVGVFVACTRETRVSVVFEAGGAGTDAVAFELDVRTGSCPSAEDFALGRAGGASVAQQSFAEGEGMSLGPLEPGRYAFIGLGRRDDCTPVLFGCVQQEVGDTDTIRIPMSTPSWMNAQLCPGGASCAAGRCGGSPDAGPADAGQDDSGQDDSGQDDAGPADAGTCTLDSDCGPSFVTRCNGDQCQPYVHRLRTLTDHASNPYAASVSLAAAPAGAGAMDVYVGTINGAEGSRAAFIESFPLATIDDIGTLMVASPSIDAGAMDVTALDIRFGGENIHWSMSGESGDDLRVWWIGTLRGPGGDTEASPLSSPDPTRPLGPDLMVGGGASGNALFYVTRTQRIGTGAVDMGGVLEGMASMGAYVPMGGVIPEVANLRGSGSEGDWLVMEQARDGDLLLWPLVLGTSGSPIPFQTHARSGSGRPTLALFEGDSYALAYPSGDGVAITPLSCGSSCVPGDVTTFPVGGAVSHAVITEMPGGAFLATAAMGPSGVVIRGSILDPDIEFVGLTGGTMIDLLPLGSTDVVHALSALTVTHESTLHLIVAAVVGPASGATRLLLADASFEP